MFGHLSSAISEQPRGQRGPWLLVGALFLPFVPKADELWSHCCIVSRENKHKCSAFVLTRKELHVELLFLHVTLLNKSVYW